MFCFVTGRHTVGIPRRRVAKNPSPIQESVVRSPGLGNIPQRSKGQPTPVLLPGRSPWDRGSHSQSMGSQKPDNTEHTRMGTRQALENYVKMNNCVR